jgi:hypothetical protein
LSRFYKPGGIAWRGLLTELVPACNRELQSRQQARTIWPHPNSFVKIPYEFTCNPDYELVESLHSQSK